MKNKFKKNDFDKYYKQVLPYIKQEKNQKYLYIILTLSVTIIFALFAINPTISTIVKLRKEIVDSKFVNEKLTQKVNALSSLSTAYLAIKSDLPFLMDAIPNNAEAPLLIAQIQSLGSEHSVNFSNIAISPISLNINNSTKSSELNFELSGKSSYENFNSFTKDLVNMQRVVVIDAISISKDDESDDINLSIKGRAFYKNE